MDIFMEDYNRAIQFGRKRNQRIEILEWLIWRKQRCP
jgi:hypothetical protein